MKKENELFVSLVVVADAHLLVLAVPRRDDEPIQGRWVVGKVAIVNGQPDWKQFATNKAFVDLLTRFLKGELAKQPTWIGARVKPGETFVVIDERAEDPHGRVLPRDIVGAYATNSDGRPILSTYEANPNHRLVTPDGRFSSVLMTKQLVEAAAEPLLRP